VAVVVEATMSPAALALLQFILQYGPAAAAKFADIMHKPDPTKDDVLGVLDAISQETYDEFIAAAKARRAATVPVP